MKQILCIRGIFRHEVAWNSICIYMLFNRFTIFHKGTRDAHKA